MTARATADTLLVQAVASRPSEPSHGSDRALPAREADRRLLPAREALWVWGLMATFHAARLAAEGLLGARIPRSAWVVDIGVWWGVWVALTPLLVWAASRWSPQHRSWRTVGLVHLGLGAAAALAHVAAMAGVFNFLDAGRGMGLEARFETFFRASFLMSLSNYAVVVLWLWARSFHRQWRAQDEAGRRLSMEVSRLALAFTDARLSALERELNPHFVSNALTSVSALVRRGDIDGAVGTLSHLGGLLRVVVSREAPRRIGLDDEVRLLDSFLAVERIRLGDRLSVDLQVDPGLREVPVPRLILQPLVENALRHGADRNGRVRVVVRAVWAGDQVVLSVRDHGPGFPEGGPAFGVGLSNTAGRLHHLFGNRAVLDLRNAPEGGAWVTIRIPVDSGDDVRDDVRDDGRGDGRDGAGREGGQEGGDE